MINYKMENQGVSISLMIDSKEIEADTQQVLSIIEKASTTIEIKEIKEPLRSWDNQNSNNDE